MRRSPVLAGGYALRRGKAPTAPIACIAFVMVVGVAFWAGVVWIGERLVALAAGGM